MIRSDEKASAQQVLFKLSDKVKDGKKFLPCCTIIPLSLIVRTAGIGYYPLLPILNLRENSINGSLARIRVWNISSFVRRHGEDEGRRQSFFQFFKMQAGIPPTIQTVRICLLEHVAEQTPPRSL